MTIIKRGLCLIAVIVVFFVGLGVGTFVNNQVQKRADDIDKSKVSSSEQKWVDDINKTLRFKVASAHMYVKILEITKKEISFGVSKYPGNETVNFAIKAEAGLEILPAGKTKNVQFYKNALSVVVEDNGKNYAKVTFDFDDEIMSETGQQRYYFDFYGYDSANLPITFVSIQGDRFLPVGKKKE